LWKEEHLRLRAEWLHTCDDTAIRESVRGFQEEEIQSDFGRIRVPALLIVAAKAGVIDDNDVAEVHRLMPAIEVRKVETAHMIPFENAEAFFAALEGFL
jgi:N-formylmaleamate deformylase